MIKVSLYKCRRRTTPQRVHILGWMWNYQDPVDVNTQYESVEHLVRSG
jgi:hypothetical protein